MNIQLAYKLLFICLMQRLCIGSKGNDDDNIYDEGNGEQIHDHHRPHLKASLSGQETEGKKKTIKKQKPKHCCEMALFVFFYE